MKTTSPLFDRSRFTVFAVVFLLVLCFNPPSSGVGSERDAKSLPGFVDGSAFSKLAGEDSELVEVNIGPPLLRALSQAGSENSDVKSLLGQLQAINAYIIHFGADRARFEQAEKLIREVEASLEHKGWERLARVREKDSKVGVFVRNSDHTIDGLVVMVADREGGEVVFANIAGVIDLARIGDLRDKLNVPGLDVLDEGKGAPGATQPRRGGERTPSDETGPRKDAPDEP